MAKSELFLFDALSAVGITLISQLPRGTHARAWSDQTMKSSVELNPNVEMNCVSLDNLLSLMNEASKANFVVFATDSFFHHADESWMRAFAELVKKSYDTCDDDVTKSFVFVSTAAVYASAAFPVDEASRVEPLGKTAQIALEIEKYLLNASANRRLKPIILRCATPYGPRCTSIGLMLFLQVAAVSTLRATVPRFYKGPRCPLVHVDDIVRAIFWLTNEPVTDQVFNVSDDECLRIGALIAATARVMNVPEYKKIVFPRLTAMPGIFRLLVKLGVGSSLERLLAQIWHQVQFCYSLEETRAPSVRDAIMVTAWPRISNERLKNRGFKFLHPSFKTSAEALYARFCADRWVPDLSQAPCRSDFLRNRVYFQQYWVGFILDQDDPNTSLPVELIVENDMPIWATHSFSSAPLRGNFSIGNRQQIAVTGSRVVKHILDVCSLATASFVINIDNRVLKFRPELTGKNVFAPYQKFSLIDEDGRIRYAGKLTLDFSAKAFAKSFRTCSFSQKI